MTEQSYKSLSLLQLRSFVETARRGSFRAAARALGLSQPTVWKQVHALRRALGADLLETHGRGCRLTPSGRRLLELAGPCVAGADSIRERFLEGERTAEIPLSVVAPARLIGEDLAPVVARFARQHPRVRFRFHERNVKEIPDAVESGAFDLGFVVLPPDRRAERPLLVFEPCYELDVLLFAPRGHPLSRRRRIELRDLKRYPMILPSDLLEEVSIGRKILETAFNPDLPSRVEARQAGVIRQFVLHGMGVALLLGVPGRLAHPLLFERALPSLGRTPVFAVRRAGALPRSTAAAFAEAVRADAGGTRS